MRILTDIIRVILTTEDDGFLLVSLDFALLDEFFFLCTDALQQDGSRLVVWVLWYKLAMNGEIEDFGFEIEPFGGKEYCINAVPANLYGLTEEELFLEMLDNLASEKDKDPLGIFASRLATMACKAAVKGNHQMSDREANALIDELLTLENPYHCPHGRPTIISMTKTELEKKFKRIV